MLCKCGCGEYFAAKRKNQLFVNDKHRIKWYNENYFGKLPVPETKTCPMCKNEFQTFTPTKRIYCSDACRKEAQKNLKFEMDVDGVKVSSGDCQICGEFHKQLGQYRGLKICLMCFYGAKFFDEGLADKYIELVKTIPTEA